MLEAVHTDLVSTISLKRSTQNLQLSTRSPADYPIFGMMFKMIPERKEFTGYAARIAARPAAQRAEAKDKELAAKAA